MKLVHKKILKGNGTVVLIPENSEDLWHTYQLIQVDDLVKGTTFRKVVNETESGVQSSKVRTTVTLSVVAVDYDTKASTIRVRGKNAEENEYIRLGAFHTLDIEVNRKFTLVKNEWDTIALDILDLACNPARSADLAAVVMHEGMANVCLITNSMTIVQAKIEVTIPRKRKGQCGNHDKALTRFFDNISQAIARHIDFNIVKVCLIASPGFLKEQFFEHMLAAASKLPDLKVLIDNKSKFVLVHSSSGFKSALNEILKDPSITAKLSDTKAIEDIKSLDTLYEMIHTNPDRAHYGLAHVKHASEALAIDTLMLTDSFLRNADVPLRKSVVTIIDDVKAANGTVKIFSSLHSSGEQLNQLSGIAAILRFPMTDFEHLEETVSDSD